MSLHRRTKAQAQYSEDEMAISNQRLLAMYQRLPSYIANQTASPSAGENASTFSAFNTKLELLRSHYKNLHIWCDNIQERYERERTRNNILEAENKLINEELDAVREELQAIKLQESPAESQPNLMSSSYTPDGRQRKGSA